MKVSEAIDQLAVEDTVWVKATVDRINNEGKHIRVMPNASFVYLDGHDEISLSKPQAEKVEVPDFVAEWYESHKDDLEDAISDQIDHGHDIVLDTRKDFDVWFFDESDHPIETLIRMKDGYTVNPKRWVVTTTDSDTCYLKRFRMGKECLDGDISKVWVGELGWGVYFQRQIQSRGGRYVG